jgi:hypothetical protein
MRALDGGLQEVGGLAGVEDPKVLRRYRVVHAVAVAEEEGWWGWGELAGDGRTSRAHAGVPAGARPLGPASCSLGVGVAVVGGERILVGTVVAERTDSGRRTPYIGGWLYKILFCNQLQNSPTLYIYISMLIFFLKLMDMQEKLLPTQRIRAIQEELAGFLIREVINERGEHYVEEEEHYI